MRLRGLCTSFEVVIALAVGKIRLSPKCKAFQGTRVDDVTKHGKEAFAAGDIL